MICFRPQFLFSAFFLVLIDTICVAQITIFDTRAEFQAVYPALNLEDFEGLSGRVDPQGLDLLENVVDSATKFGPIEPGDIEAGISLTTVDDGFDGLVLLNPASPEGVTSNLLGPNLYVDSLALDLSADVDAIGLDLFSFENEPGFADVTFFNGRIDLATIRVLLDTQGTFVGIGTAGATITRIELSNEWDSEGGMANGELIDDIEFHIGEACLLGDADGDGAVNLLDVHEFIMAILESQYRCTADINQDSIVDLLDVEPFVKVLMAQ